MESSDISLEYSNATEECRRQECVDYTSKLVEITIDGIEAEEKIYRFHKWLITTMNNDLDPIDDLTENEIQIDELNKKLNILKRK